MVAWPGHPHLTLLRMILLLRLIPMMMKTRREQRRRKRRRVKPLEDLPTSFWCLMTKGEEDRLKLEGLALLFSVLFFLEKPDCPILLRRNLCCLFFFYL
jgi:hypothetical protein